jgi:hypothetical protein
MNDLALTSPVATLILLVTCLAGYQYRRVWKNEGPRYQYWVFGLIAAAGILLLGFVPLQLPG